MKKQAFSIVRRYRKCFVALAIKDPKNSVTYWTIYTDQLNGLLDMLACDTTISHIEFVLMVKYFYKKFNELYDIYCK